MTNTAKRVTAGSTVGDWLAHPEGGAALRHILGQGGFDAAALARSSATCRCSSWWS